MRACRPAAGVALALALAGCTAGDRDRSSESSTPSPSTRSPSPAPSATTVEPSQTWSDPTRVVGPVHGIEVLRTLPSLGGGPTVWHVLDDGRLLIHEDGRLRLEDPRTGSATAVVAPDDDPGGIAFADDDGRYLSWVTSAATDLFTFPWRLYTLDLRTGATRVVARHHDVGVDPVPVAPNGTRPRVHDGRVYYSAVRRIARRGAVIPAIYSVPADGSDPPRVEVTNAYQPELLGDELVYTRSDFGFVDWTLFARPLDRQGEARVVAFGPGRRSRLSGTSSDGRTLMWLARNGGRCTIHLAFSDGRERALPTGGCGKVWTAYPEIADGIAVFSRNASNGYVTLAYRLPYGPLVRLTRGQTWGQSYTNGDIITWRPAGGPRDGTTFIGRLHPR